MGYYMRFFDTSSQPFNLEAIAAALREVGPAYRVEIHPETDSLQGELFYGDEPYAELEINQPGDGLFDEEMEEQVASLEDAKEGDPAPVAETLRAAMRIVAVRVLFGGRESDETLDRLGPLWDWLFASQSGLLQADGEGFYSREALVLAVE